MKSYETKVTLLFVWWFNFPNCMLFTYETMQKLSGDLYLSNSTSDTVDAHSGSDQILNREELYDKSIPQNNMQTKNLDEDKRFRFSKELYITEMSKKKILKDSAIPLDISLLNKNKEANIVIMDADSKQGFSKYLKAVEKAGKVTLIITEDVSEDIISKLSQLMFIIKAMEENDSCHAVIILNLVNPAEVPTIKFEHDEYKTDILAEQRGFIGQYRVVLMYKENAVVKYKLNLNSESLANSLRIDENEGILSVIDSLNTGDILVKIEAYVVGDAALKAETTVHLVVSHVVVCGTNSEMFSYSLLTKHIPEKQLIENILPPSKPYPNCVYSITSQFPKGDYFALNSNDGSLNLTKPVDRKSPTFDGIKIPSFMLHIEIVCKEKQSERLTEMMTSNAIANIDITDITDIKYNPKKLLLNIVVGRVGVNRPTFSESHLVVGYPANFSLLQSNSPPYLTVVKATMDTDPKENAKIQYSILEAKSCPFHIHPTTGTIYPWKYHDSMQDVSFTVVATKMINDKSSDERSTMKILVKFLMQSQIVEFTYKNALLDDVQRVLKEASVVTKTDVQALSAAVIPYNKEVHNLGQTDGDTEVLHLLQLLIYGVNENATVVDGNELSWRLSKLKNTLQAETMHQRILIIFKGREYSVFTLLLIFLGLALVSGLLLILYTQKRAKTKDNNSRVPLNEDAEPISHAHWISNAQLFSAFNGSNNFSTSTESSINVRHLNRSSTRSNNNFISPEKLLGEDVVLMNSQNCQYVKTNNSLQQTCDNAVSTFKPDTTEQQSSVNNSQPVNVATISPLNYAVPNSIHPNTTENSCKSADPLPLLPKSSSRKVIKP